MLIGSGFVLALLWISSNERDGFANLKDWSLSGRDMSVNMNGNKV